jgi:uracil-DNA glycosylase
MRELGEFLRAELRAGRPFAPPAAELFSAFVHCPLERVRVIILGQDPYHGPGQAHGLAFSVRPGIAAPPSLRNILTELRDDLGCPLPPSGDLRPWARRGVLLLNSVLSVRLGAAGSHAGRGWERFTSRVLEVLNESERPLVFLAWGRAAAERAAAVDRARHTVIEAAHPSPLSAHRGFLGSRPFSKANAALVAAGEQPLEWCLARAG